MFNRVYCALAYAVMGLPMLLPSTSFAKDIVVHAAHLIDGVSERARDNVSVLIHDDRIVAVQDGFVNPVGAEILEFANGTVLPGLVDVHIHVTAAGIPDPTKVSNEELAYRSVVAVRRTLLAGFTAIRDVASLDVTLVVALKHAIQRGDIPGPRMWVSGQGLSPTGGHMDPSNGLPPVWRRDDDWRAGVVDSPEEAVRAVRWMRQQGADLIKIAPSGGVASVGDDPTLQLMSDEEIKAVVTTAHSLGMKVAAHAHGKAAIDSAVRLGVDSIEHGTFADAASYALMKAHGTYLVGTLTVAHDILNIARNSPDKLPPGVAQKTIEVTPTMDHNVTAAYKAGVKLAVGGDIFGLEPWGSETREFEYMVEAGVAPMDAILAGTRGGADLIGDSADIGSIQAGRFADIIVVPGDPLKDIKVLQHVEFVMKGGEIFKRDGKPTAIEN